MIPVRSGNQAGFVFTQNAASAGQASPAPGGASLRPDCPLRKHLIPVQEHVSLLQLSFQELLCRCLVPITSKTAFLIIKSPLQWIHPKSCPKARFTAVPLRSSVCPLQSSLPVFPNAEWSWREPCNRAKWVLEHSRSVKKQWDKLEREQIHEGAINYRDHVFGSGNLGATTPAAGKVKAESDQCVTSRQVLSRGRTPGEMNFNADLLQPPLPSESLAAFERMPQTQANKSSPHRGLGLGLVARDSFAKVNEPLGTFHLRWFQVWQGWRHLSESD